MRIRKVRIWVILVIPINHMHMCMWRHFDAIYGSYLDQLCLPTFNIVFRNKQTQKEPGTYLYLDNEPGYFSCYIAKTSEISLFQHLGCMWCHFDAIYGSYLDQLCFPTFNIASRNKQTQKAPWTYLYLAHIPGYFWCYTAKTSEISIFQHLGCMWRHFDAIYGSYLVSYIQHSP